MAYEEVQAICKFLQTKTQVRPVLGIIAGSGLGGLADRIDEKEEFSYTTIPNFPVSTGEC